MLSKVKLIKVFLRLSAFICLFFSSDFAVANKVDTLSFFGSKSPKRDTVFSINALSNFEWNVEQYNKNGLTKKYYTDQVDTIQIQNKIPEGALLTTVFYVDSSMLNKVQALFYNTNGSVKISINNEVVALCGVFDGNKHYTDVKSEQKDYKYFILKKNKNVLQVQYLPALKRHNLNIRLGDAKWAAGNLKDKKDGEIRSYAVATFYFSFAIVLILFYFFIKNQEYLFFGLYCLATFLQYLSEVLTQTPTIKVLSAYSFLISLELLAIFMALAINKIHKTKIPLFLMIAVLIFSLIFPDDFIVTIKFVKNIEIPVIRFLSYVIFLSYSLFSFAYHWIQGFGHKNWDAKLLTYGTGIGILLFLLPIGYAMNKSFDQQNISDNILNTLFTISAGVYPITVAIVLARRYGKNQTQLIEQVQTIKKLGEENLLQETEKKNILAQQNILLENKVTERTFELEEKNKEILNKNKEITDSLIYAKRIQAAVLPNLNTVYKILDQSFILYLPKDIVSGDFYEFTQKENKHIIAAADCTGHGVAGAFMSIIGSSLIKSIINEKNITAPSGILDALNEGIINSLKQHESETHDGMDISICSFDTKNMSLEFAGANRPLWLIRNDELIVYAADKFPIGGLQIKHNNQFTNHQIKIQPKDTIYLFSDGYADQFGGEHGKKLMTKKLKEILVSIQHLSMNEQKIYLQNYFNEWKGNNEQVDDVLIIGIRI
ncbi:MAG TPA: SpoIIE family protein phosphatase [Bacteroidia bacterium]|nr:SpoIIE family protein phosphatase [Bacteroidia bacterium]MBP7713192.1 SpoIIE family protein phosphatase [Bacteroidia bacterium]MBP8667259.1 SpoIIE family protein phosphatase [Bacteroidia bacterium]HOZ83367.1 SpoIIE family protein phosphatase [Bacteroidia bacterium]HOZ90448.1 SpoIIE family protein phosphatase [Bacteroidia bacterium]